MERVDIFDDKGNPTGEVKTKAEAHKAEDWHPGVHVWIVNPEKEILFQKRADDKELWPGKWDVSVGGHVSSGETPTLTALREVREELGIYFEENHLRHLFDMAQATPSRNGLMHRAWDYIYLATTDVSISDLKLQKEEVSEAKFIPCHEFESLLAADPSAFVPRQEEYKKILQELNK